MRAWVNEHPLTFCHEFEQKLNSWPLDQTDSARLSQAFQETTQDENIDDCTQKYTFNLFYWKLELWPGGYDWLQKIKMQRYGSFSVFRWHHELDVVCVYVYFIFLACVAVVSFPRAREAREVMEREKGWGRKENRSSPCVSYLALVEVGGGLVCLCGLSESLFLVGSMLDRSKGRG